MIGVYSLLSRTLSNCMNRWAGAIILNIAYGYNKTHSEDMLCLTRKIERVIREELDSVKPGAYLVDSIPFREVEFTCFIIITLMSYLIYSFVQ